MVNTVLLGGFFDPATPDSAQADAGHGNSDSSRILEAVEPRRPIQISSTSECTMPAITRPVRQSDIPAMAAIRAQEWGDRGLLGGTPRLVSEREALSAAGTGYSRSFCCRE
jgi:hypothetical protein